MIVGCTFSEFFPLRINNKNESLWLVTLQAYLNLHIISCRVYMFWPNLWECILFTYIHSVRFGTPDTFGGNKTHTISNRLRNPIASEGVSSEWKNKKKTTLSYNKQRTTKLRFSSFLVFFIFIFIEIVSLIHCSNSVLCAYLYVQKCRFIYLFFLWTDLTLFHPLHFRVRYQLQPRL